MHRAALVVEVISSNLGQHVDLVFRSVFQVSRPWLFLPPENFGHRVARQRSIGVPVWLDENIRCSLHRRPSVIGWIARAVLPIFSQLCHVCAVWSVHERAFDFLKKDEKGPEVESWSSSRGSMRRSLRFLASTSFKILSASFSLSGGTRLSHHSKLSLISESDLQFQLLDAANFVEVPQSI
jgi:hypothetical protein